MIDYPNSTKAKKYYLCLSFEHGYKTPAAKVAEPEGGTAAAKFDVSGFLRATIAPSIHLSRLWQRQQHDVPLCGAFPWRVWCFKRRENVWFRIKHLDEDFRSSCCLYLLQFL